MVNCVSGKKQKQKFIKFNCLILQKHFHWTWNVYNEVFGGRCRTKTIFNLISVNCRTR